VELYNNLQNKSFFVALFLIALTPILGVETPRAITFVPLISLLFLWPNLNAKNFKLTKSEETMIGFFVLFSIFIFGHSLWLSVSPDAMDRAIKAIPLLLGGVLFLYMLPRTPEFNNQKFYKILIGICSLCALIITLENILDAPIYRMIRSIDDDTGVGAAVFNRGSVIVVTIFLTAFFLLVRKKTIFIALSIIPVVAMLFSIESQSAQLGFFFALAFYFLFPIHMRFFWGALYVALCVYLLIFPFVMPIIYEFVPADIYQNGFLQNSYASIRVEIWDFISRKIQENPWTGFGLEFTRGYEDFDARQIYTQRTVILHPHNFVLQFWIEMGLVGILFLKAAIAMIFIGLYNNKNHLVKKGGLAMLVTFILLNSFSYGFWQAWWIGLMFIISGLILLVSNNSDDIKNVPKKGL